MEYNVEVVEGVSPHRVVPIRFARAVYGEADGSAPDLDDRGFIPDRFCSAHGPVIGVIPGREVRVRVIRDRIDAAAPLFVSVDDPIVEITHPGPGEALDSERAADGVYFRGSRNVTRTKMTMLKVRYGSPQGPVLAELAIRIYPLLTIPVAAHAVTIGGVEPAIDRQDFQGLLDRMNRFYSQAGIRFVLRSWQRDTTSMKFFAPGRIVIAFDPQGAMTNPPGLRELLAVLSACPRASALNVHVIRYPVVLQGTGFMTGIGAREGFFQAGHAPGVIFAPEGDVYGDAHVLAHEAGHVLRLEHYALAQLKQMREDLWAHRNLLYLMTRLHSEDSEISGSHECHSTPARRQTGYGGDYPGGLLGTKVFRHIRQANQISVLRRAVLSRTWAPK